jgi:hypothetical protein
MPEHPPEHHEKQSAGQIRKHPDPGLLEGLMRGDLPAAERRSVVRHLLTGCPRCLEVTRRYWRLSAGLSGAEDKGRPTQPSRRAAEAPHRRVRERR